MSVLPMHLEAVFFWLLRATVTTSVLVGLILLFQWGLGRRLGIRSRCFLWLILLVLLALPWMPRGPLDPKSWPFPSRMKGYASSLPGWSNRHDGSEASNEVFADGALLARRVDETMACRKLPWPAASGLNAPTARLVGLVWLAGIGGFVTYVVVSYARLRRVLAGAAPVADPAVLALLDNCKRLLGVRAKVGVVTTDVLGSPALFGFARPRLLLQPALLVDSARGDLRHIFLHELAHLKRRDILVGHLASLVHILQWFNPLVALACRRIRIDRELACDAMALSVLGPDETTGYGRTIVRQLDRRRAADRLPVLASLSGDKARIKQRIAMIAGFDGAHCRQPPLTTAFVIGLACISLAVRFAGTPALGTAAEAAFVAWEVRARRDLPTTHQDKHANIHRTCIRNMLTGKFLVVDGERAICDADEPGEAGLWEARFDVDPSTAEGAVYLYSVAARRYLTSDEAGKLAVDAEGPTEAARWSTCPRPQGLWWISQYCPDGYLRAEQNGQVRAVPGGRDAPSYWGGRAVWRVKTSEDPAANAQWYREKIPGPD